MIRLIWLITLNFTSLQEVTFKPHLDKHLTAVNANNVHSKLKQEQKKLRTNLTTATLKKVLNKLNPIELNDHFHIFSTHCRPERVRVSV